MNKISKKSDEFIRAFKKYGLLDKAIALSDVSYDYAYSLIRENDLYKYKKCKYCGSLKVVKQGSHILERTLLNYFIG